MVGEEANSSKKIFFENRSKIIITNYSSLAQLCQLKIAGKNIQEKLLKAFDLKLWYRYCKKSPIFKKKIKRPNKIEYLNLYATLKQREREEEEYIYIIFYTSIPLNLCPFYMLYSIIIG